MILCLCTDTNASGLVCCIYHKPRKFDESSSEESSSDSDSDSDSSCDSCNVPHHSAGGQHRPNRPVPNANGAGPSNTRSRDGAAVVHEMHEDDGGRNAYERDPSKKPKNPNQGKPIPQGHCECSLEFVEHNAHHVLQRKRNLVVFLLLYSDSP